MKINLGLKGRILIVIGIVAFTGVVGMGMAIHTAQNYESDSVTLSKAGSLQVLVQKMTKEALVIMIKPSVVENRSQLLDSIEQFERHLEAMINGNDKIDVTKPESKEVQAQLATINNKWPEFKRQLLTIRKGEVKESLARAFTYVLEHNTGLLKDASLVSELLGQDAKKTARYQVFALWVGILLIFTITLAAYILSSVFLRRVNNSIDKFHQAVKSSLQITNQLKEASIKVSESTNEQASAIQESVATLDEINSMLARGVNNADKTRSLSQESRKDATEGKLAVDSMIQSMQEISESNQSIMSEIDNSNERITDIIGVINEISTKTEVINDIVFQTKLLSFNASVEAARAGEHGKGFAVVAEEVGNLAHMSGQSAKEIGEMLDSSISKVRNIVDETKKNVSVLADSGKSKVDSGVQVAYKCGKILDEVFENVSQVDEMMGDISSASSEQAEGVNNISTAMNELDQATHMNANVAGETSDFANELARRTNNLWSYMEDLQALISGKAKPEIKTENKAQIKNNVRSLKKTFASPKKIQKSTPKTTKPVLKKAAGSDDLPSSDDPRFEEI